MLQLTGYRFQVDTSLINDVIGKSINDFIDALKSIPLVIDVDYTSEGQFVITTDSQYSQFDSQSILWNFMKPEKELTERERDLILSMPHKSWSEMTASQICECIDVLVEWLERDVNHDIMLRFIACNDWSNFSQHVIPTKESYRRIYDIFHRTKLINTTFDDAYAKHVERITIRNQSSFLNTEQSKRWNDFYTLRLHDYQKRPGLGWFYAVTLTKNKLRA